MKAALIDDQLLSRVLLGRAPRTFSSKRLYTTGYWYVRLCQAALGADERNGVLSQPFRNLPPNLRAGARAALLELPDEIGLLSLRDLGPTIAELRNRHQLNILGIEALAAASRLGAQVYLSATSPLLERALSLEDIEVKVLGGR